MTTSGQNWLIRLCSWVALAAGGAGLLFHEAIAISVLGNNELWRRIVILGVMSAVIIISLGIEKEARKRLRKAS